MNTLSQQIRDLVEQSSTSSYAIAREAGIDKSAMSRFMNGGSLTMKKLDQLASVLGVTVTAKISKVPLPLEKGRPSMRKRKMIASAKIRRSEYSKMVEEYAQHAHDNCFQSHRGFWWIDSYHCLIYYNNHPYGSNPNLRGDETSRIKRQLKKSGFTVLASAYSGEIIEDERLTDEGERFTLAMAIACSSDQIKQVENIVGLEISESERRISEIHSRTKKS